MEVEQILKWGNNKLKRRSALPALDAEVLLAHVLKKDRAFLFTNPDKKLSKPKTINYKLLVKKHAHHFPVAYLTGHKEFFGLDFKVTPAVLIPRPETELLVEQAIRAIKDKRLAIRKIVDLGTGSGNIIISLAKHLAQYNRLVYYTTQFYGIDYSKKALWIARANARRHSVANKIKFLRGNLLTPLAEHWSLGFGHSLILANLPYLTPTQYRANPDLKHEPRSALVAGKDGLKYYRELLKQLCSILPSPFDSTQGQNRITILIEHDPSQKPALQTLVKKYFPTAKIIFHKDLASHYRILEIIIPHRHFLSRA